MAQKHFCYHFCYRLQNFCYQRECFCYHWPCKASNFRQISPFSSEKCRPAALKKVKRMKKRINVVFDRKGAVAKTGSGKIELSIYLQAGQRRYETVGTATADQWEAEAQSKQIQSKVKHYEQVINAMMLLGEDMTLENFNRHVCLAMNTTQKNEDSRHMFNGHDQRQSFPDFIEEYMEKEGIKPGTKRRLIVVVDALKRANMLLTLEDLTPANLRKFDEYLHAQGDKSLSTIYGYHKRIHKYTRILWRNEMIASDPYNHVQFKRGSHKERVPLIEDELIKMREAELTGRLDRVRDMFIFMAYTGLAYVDMCSFDFKTMAEKQGEYYYIDSARTKTGSKFYTPILPPAMEVLKKYDYQLPIITNQKMNDYLHLIQDKLGINKNITCHIARHSFATLLLTYDFPMDKTARTLGHKDVKTTQIYGKILKKTIVQHTEHLIAAIR